jgi:hypothetical protein
MKGYTYHPLARSDMLLLLLVTVLSLCVLPSASIECFTGIIRHWASDFGGCFGGPCVNYIGSDLTCAAADALCYLAVISRDQGFGIRKTEFLAGCTDIFFDCSSLAELGYPECAECSWDLCNKGDDALISGAPTPWPTYAPTPGPSNAPIPEPTT